MLHQNSPMPPRPLTIDITDNRCSRAVRFIFVFAMLSIVPISIGIVAGSTAMQWMGFGLSIVLLIGWSRVDNITKRFTSIDDAIVHLNNLKK